MSATQKQDGIEINSVYGKSKSQIERDLNNVLYWDNKKGQQFIDSFGYQLPPSPSNADLCHNYKTDQDLNQYILVQNSREHAEQFLKTAEEIKADLGYAPSKQHNVKIPADDKGSKLGSSKNDEHLAKLNTTHSLADDRQS